MAKLADSYQCLFYKVMYGLFSLASEVLQSCSSAAVEKNCSPCGQGEYCSIFFGMCLPCKDYCPGGPACPKACASIKLNNTTIPTATTEPISIESRTTSRPMASSISTDAHVLVHPPQKAYIPSQGGGTNTFLQREYNIMELSFELVFGLFISISIVMVIGVCCLRYRKTLKISSMCPIFTGEYRTGTDIELNVMNSRNHRHTRETGRNIPLDPMENETSARRQQTVSRYTAVQDEDAEDNNFINRPGTSRSNSSRSPTAEAASPAHSEHSPSGSRSTPAPIDAERPRQSASIHPGNASSWEREHLIRAVPTDHQSEKQKTPDTHRKISDGTHKGHEWTTGASPFIPPANIHGDPQFNNNAGHGD